MHEHDNRRAAEIGNMRKAADGIEAGIGIRRRRNHVRADAGDAEGVAVGLGSRECSRSNQTAAAAAVFDEELLVEFFTELVRDNARQRIGAAARRERRDDFDRFRGPSLCFARRPGEGRRNEDTAGNHAEYCTHAIRPKRPVLGLLSSKLR